MAKIQDEYRQWLKDVDAEINKVCGLGANDLADQPYNDWYGDGLTPQEAAREALEDEGFPFE